MQKVITKEIAEKIVQLRAAGAGYRQIAIKTGIKADTIKKYCKRHGISGYLGGIATQ